MAFMETPNEKQALFFLANTPYVAYGGARGGGKSWAVRRKAEMLAAKYKGIKILIVRRTLSELDDNHRIPMMTEVGNLAQWRDSEKTFLFKNGSRIKLGYCDREDDVLQYQGKEFDVIFIDEATQLTEFQYTNLKYCCRGVNDFPKRIYITCNPGGVGHEWVKRLFITKEYTHGENPDDYTFIPAKATDNFALKEKMPEYLKMLDELPDGIREAWRDGSWDCYDGQAFGEFDRNIHVCTPFSIPQHWKRYFSLDYGLDMTAGLWIALDEHGTSYVYKEAYRKDLIISEAAAYIKSIEDGDTIYQRLAPPDLWNRQRESGRSIIDQFGDYGLWFDKSSNERIAGWLAVKEALKIIENESGYKTSRLLIFPNCTNLIRCLPKLQYDDKKPGDVATEPHELTHLPDALRGYCISWKSNSKPLPQSPVRFSFSMPSPPPSPVGFGEKLCVV
jgi:phage terminase large subunit